MPWMAPEQVGQVAAVPGRAPAVQMEISVPASAERRGHSLYLQSSGPSCCPTKHAGALLGWANMLKDKSDWCCPILHREPMKSLAYDNSSCLLAGGPAVHGGWAARHLSAELPLATWLLTRAASAGSDSFGTAPAAASTAPAFSCMALGQAEAGCRAARVPEEGCFRRSSPGGSSSSSSRRSPHAVSARVTCSRAAELPAWCGAAQ